MEERKLEEKKFADERYSGRFQYEDNKKYYSINRKSGEFIKKWIEKNCVGKKVLDYACGLDGGFYFEKT